MYLLFMDYVLDFIDWYYDMIFFFYLFYCLLYSEIVVI